MESSDDDEVHDSLMEEALNILKQEGFTLPGDVVDTLKTVAKTNSEARQKGHLKGHRVCKVQSSTRKFRNMRESNTKPNQERPTLSKNKCSDSFRSNHFGKMSNQSFEDNDTDNVFEDVTNEKVNKLSRDTSSGTESTCSVSTVREAGKINNMLNTAQVHHGSSSSFGIGACSAKGAEEIRSSCLDSMGSDTAYNTSIDQAKQIHKARAENLRNINKHIEDKLSERTSKDLKREISKDSGFTEADSHYIDALKNPSKPGLSIDIQNTSTHQVNDVSLFNSDVCERFVDSQSGQVHAVTTSSSDLSAAEMIKKSDELLDDGTAVSTASKLTSQECNSNIAREISKATDGDRSKEDEYESVNKISKSSHNNSISTSATGVTTAASRNAASMEQGLYKEKYKLATSDNGGKVLLDMSVDQQLSRNQELNNIEQSEDGSSKLENKKVSEKAQLLKSHKEEKIGSETDSIYAIVKATHHLEANAKDTQNEGTAVAADGAVITERSDSTSSSLNENTSSEKQTMKRSPDGKSSSIEHVEKSDNSSILKSFKTISECKETDKEKIENTVTENSNSMSNTLSGKCEATECVNGFNLRRMASTEESNESKMKSSRSVSNYSTKVGTDGEIPCARRLSSISDCSNRQSISGLSKENIEPPTYEETLSNLSRQGSVSSLFSGHESSASSIASSAGAFNERQRKKEAAMTNEKRENRTGGARTNANYVVRDSPTKRQSSCSSDSTLSVGEDGVIIHPIKIEVNARYARSLTDSAIGQILNRRTTSHSDAFVSDDNKFEVRDEYRHQPRMRGEIFLDSDIDEHFGSRQYNNTRSKYDILKGDSFKREVMNMVDNFFDDDDDDHFSYGIKSKHRRKYSDEEFEFDRILANRLDANPYKARDDLSKLNCKENGDAKSETLSNYSYAASDTVNPGFPNRRHCEHINTVSESGYKIPNRQNKHSNYTASHSDSKFKDKLRDVDNNQYHHSCISLFSGSADENLQCAGKSILTEDKDINASILDHKVKQSENSTRYKNVNYDNRSYLRNAGGSERQTKKFHNESSSRVIDMSDADSAHSLPPALNKSKEEYANNNLINGGTSLPDIADRKGSTELESKETAEHWNKRRSRIDKALSWIRTELGVLRTQDKVLMSQFQKCQDSIEQLKKQRPWYEIYSDDEEEDEKHWEDWEIDDFDRAYQAERLDLF